MINILNIVALLLWVYAHYNFKCCRIGCQAFFLIQLNNIYPSLSIFSISKNKSCSRIKPATFPATSTTNRRALFFTIIFFQFRQNHLDQGVLTFYDLKGIVDFMSKSGGHFSDFRQSPGVDELFSQLIFFLIHTFHAADNAACQKKNDGNNYRTG